MHRKLTATHAVCALGVSIGGERCAIRGWKTLCLSLAAITKHHRLGGLNNRHLFLTVLEARKSKIKVPAPWFPVRALSLDCRQPPSSGVLTTLTG